MSTQQLLIAWRDLGIKWQIGLLFEAVGVAQSPKTLDQGHTVIFLNSKAYLYV